MPARPTVHPSVEVLCALALGKLDDSMSAGHPLRSCRAGVGCAWGNTPCLISLTSRMTMSWQHGS